MRIKKYIADTMPEAMQLIRKDLGPDAIILHSKEINHGRFFGLFKKKKLEVVAAIDPNPVPEKKEVPVVKSQMQQSVKPVEVKVTDQNEVLSEIKKLQAIIELQNEKMKDELPVNFQLLEKRLRAQEVTPELSEHLLEKTQAKWQQVNLTPEIEDFSKELIKVISEELTPYIAEGISRDKQIIQFVGPTGVGKTTTIAKVASDFLLKHKKKVAFITMDTYRIAAIEQLKTYARILNVPLEVVYNIEDYKKALNKLSAYDYIFVDTAGRNFRDEKYIRELKEMFGDFDEIATYLVLSLTAKPKDIIEIYEQFQTIPLMGCVFTKLDETTQYGSILNVVLERQLKLAYITNGQDVPDDLVTMTALEIAELIVGDSDA